MARIDFRDEANNRAAGSIFRGILLQCSDNSLTVDSSAFRTFSDHRNCQTSGPCLRFFLIKLPRCILSSCAADGVQKEWWPLNDGKSWTSASGNSGCPLAAWPADNCFAAAEAMS